VTVPAVSEAAPARRSDLAARTVGGIAMILVALACLWFGGIAFWLLTSAAAMVMLWEWAGLSGVRRAPVALAVFAVPLLYASPLFGAVDRTAVALLVSAAMLVGLSGSGRLGAGLLYAGLPALALLFLRDQPNGIGLTLWTMAVVWATDIGAYFAGRSIGGPKLAPVISPNKTWAGLGGGMIAAAVIGALLAGAFDLPAKLAFLGGIAAVLAQAGDLYESWLKRRAGVKDSGHILPGHGGVLDRLDGLVPVAVLIATLAASGWL
jgi:phosphatidate cytidylyltransferase